MVPSSPSGLRFTAFITALTVVASLIFTWVLLGMGQTFFATMIVLGYVIALWRHPRIATFGHPRHRYAILGIIGSVAYAFFWLFGQLAGAPAMGFGPNPPVMILFFVLFMWMYGAGRFVNSNFGMGGMVIYLAVVIFVVVTGFPGVFPGLGQVMLGGSWGNAGGLVGEAGFALEQALDNRFLSPIADTYEYTTSRVLNPSRNRNLAQLVCAGELLTGGGVFEVASGSASMSQCVENKLAQNETQARSEQVTQPVELAIDEPRIEPFTDHVRVGIPLTNTIVYDLQGVPIDIPAREVSVEVRWRYLDEEVITRQREIPQIPNGDTRLVEFEGSESSGYNFSTFPVILEETDQSLRTKLIEVKDEERSADWFLSRIDNGELSGERVVFLIRQEDAVSCSQMTDDEGSNGGDMQTLCDGLESHDIGFDPVLPQGREYTVEIAVSYDYQAEAAFTESSRWRSGNQLLEIWTEAAWQEMPLSERDAWRRTKCGEIDKYGQTFIKQRTAALTTPVVPVMYTDCGISLFRGIEQGVEEEIEIEVGANVNEQSDAAQMLDEDEGFRIESATTTCTSDEDQYNLTNNEAPANRTLPSDWFTHTTGVGWTSGDSDVAVIPRDVTVQGQRQSIACRTQMDLELNLVTETTYQIPNIG